MEARDLGAAMMDDGGNLRIVRLLVLGEANSYQRKKLSTWT